MVADFTESRPGDSGADDCWEYSVGDAGLPSLSSTTFCDENEGPKVDSSKSADGSCDGVASVALLRGERGSLLVDRGLFVSDEFAMGPADTSDDDADAPPPGLTADDAPAAVLLESSAPPLLLRVSQSLDLAVLMPLRPLDPNGVSASLGDKFRVLIRLQSLEKTSMMLWRILLSTASISHPASESLSLMQAPSLFLPAMPLVRPRR